MMHLFKYIQIFAVALVTSAFTQEIYFPSSSAVLDCIEKTLPHCGILRVSDGFVYVDVDDAYVHKLIPLIEQDGFQEPPYFGAAGLVGAHITVMYPAETEKYGIGKIEEIGELIAFVPQKCCIAHPPRWKGIDEVYFVVVDAPQLEQIRKKYGLPRQEYEYHITIGVKPKMENAANL